MPSTDDMSEAAKIAYQAFLDMSASKQAHLGRLEAIDAIYEAGGVPGPDEKHELEKLLAAHDRNVLAFKTAIEALGDDEKQALIALMS